MEQRVEMALKKMHIEHLREKQIYKLSGGEKKMASIATILSMNPEMILMDEPTSNLDSLNEGIILKSLKESARKKTVVLVSHRVSTMNVADVVYEMENGRIS